MRYTQTWMMAAILPMMTSTLSAGEPFALVELFTSEGCSSCPRADKHASDLVEQASEDDRNLYVLSFHVDYWDRLGWKDPYSSAGATERQSAYAQAWRARTAYTPQMVVNGAVGFNGSDRERAKEEIDKALKRPAPVDVVAEVNVSGADELKVNASIEMDVELLHRDWDVVAAVVERGLSQKPDRGENKGRKLAHDNVVRVFDTKALETDDASFILEVPDDVDREKSSVIVFVQDQRTRKILGVTRIDLPKNE